MGSWHTGDRFIVFFRETMLLVLENLITSKVLLCESREEEGRFLFVKYHRVRDYLSYSPEFTDQVPLGYLEDLIIQDVTKNPGTWIKDCLQRLFSFILNDTATANPAKEILLEMIQANLFKYWSHTDKYVWFSCQIELQISESMEMFMEQLLSPIRGNIEHQRISDPEFTLLSKRLAKRIQRQMMRWQDNG